MPEDRFDDVDRSFARIPRPSRSEDILEMMAASEMSGKARQGVRGWAAAIPLIAGVGSYGSLLSYRETDQPPASSFSGSPLIPAPGTADLRGGVTQLAACTRVTM
jgi:hypothetical protein